jgi:DNA polymerase I-like protein with 3'-5' exonuclease and polymerase domains
MIHPKEGLEYGCSDGIFTYKLWFALKDKLGDQDKRIYDLEKSFCNVIREMERNRVHLNVDRVNQLYVECKAALESTGDYVRQIIESKTGKTGKWLRLNVGSTAQLSECLFTDPEGLKLKPLPSMEGGGDDGGGGGGDSDDNDDDDSGNGEVQYSLKDEVIKALHKVYGEKLSVQREGVKDKDGKPKKESLFDLILEYRHYDKMKGSYVEKFFKSHDKYGDVRPAFNQMGTDTARLSSKAEKIENGYSGVNFQGIPRDSDEDKPELFKQIRTCIAPREGWFLVKLDYSGEELRVVTNLSGDPIWTKTFLHGDGDVHSITARTLFAKQNVNKDERNRGKRCNFAFIYGGGAGAIQRNIDCSMEDAQRHMDNLRRDVPVLMGYVDAQKLFARKNKCIFTAFGRRIPIPTIDSPIQAIKRKAERCAINYTIQSTSADILKFALCYVDKQLRTLGWKQYCRYVLTVHDEIVFEIKPEWLMTIVPKLDEWMTTPWKLPKAHGRDWVVPLETEPGIDIHWRARYDFFKMTRGEPADPKKIREDGSYSDDLKKGTIYENGRIYQEIPDFLKLHIRRNGSPELPTPEEVQTPASVEATPLALVDAAAHSSSHPPAQEEPVPPPKSEPPPIQQERAPSPKSMSPTMEKAASERGPALGFDVEFNLDDPLPSPTLSPTSTPKPSPTSPVPEPQKSTADIYIDPTEKVLRWTIKCALSKSAARKLDAVLILAEGETLIRVLSLDGNILIPESQGIRIHQEKFLFLADMFGLG